MESKISDSKEVSNSNYYCILNKIKSKPIILDKIYSFSTKRSFIILDLVSNDKTLKLKLQKTFYNSKKNNNLSSELNININNYIYFRKLKENISIKINELKEKYFKFNEHLNEVIQKPININEFIENKNTTQPLKNRTKKNIEEKKIGPSVFIQNYPGLVKKYRKKCRKNGIKNESYDIYKENKKTSIINTILKEYYNNPLKNINIKEIITFCFDYLSTQDNFFLYNLPGKNSNELEESEEYEFLDLKYLNYLEKINSKQKMKLICIINRYKYSEYINNITYPYINEIYFNLFTDSSFNDLFMFDKFPINEIYSIFITYFIIIKHYNNIKKIFFGEEFFINKNQFISFNDEYYQSIISYLIDQYFYNYNKTKENFLDKINLEEIDLKENKLDNIYEKFKVIYGFNKMFPNLKNKKLIEIKYEDIINKNYTINNNNNCSCIIFSINFENKKIKDDINTIIETINIFINKNLSNSISTIEILCFYNIKLDYTNSYISSNNFNTLPNLKEFFIYNNTGGNIINNSLKFKKLIFDDNKFDFLYLGYDLNNNLVYYRNGKSRIKSTDILDLFNILNYQITKLELKYEKINITFNKDKTELKIINLLKEDNTKNNTIHSDNYYYYTLKYLYDFIYNQNSVKSLIIDGFDFTFEEIENKNIKKLYLNYYKDENCKELFEYKLNTYNKNIETDIKTIEEDINLKIKFPELEEISVGNLKDESFLFKKLFKVQNLGDKLKQINIISYDNYKVYKIKGIKDININIIYEKENFINDEEYEYEEDEYNEEEEIFDDYKYSNILKKENPVKMKKKKKKKFF